MIFLIFTFFSSYFFLFFNYSKEKPSAKALALEKRDKELKLQKERENSDRAYEDWYQQKQQRNVVLKAIDLLEKPKDMIKKLTVKDGGLVQNSDSDSDSDDSYTNFYSPASGREEKKGESKSDYLSRSQSKLRSSIQTKASLSSTLTSKPTQFEININNKKHMEIFDLIVRVGKALKLIDRSLFPDFSRWCEEVLTPKQSLILWDYFYPKSCDIHSSTLSQAREIFMKFVKPGIDYRKSFIDFIKKKFNGRIERIKADRGYFHADDYEKKEIDQDLEGLLKEWSQNTAISKDEFKVCLIEMGIKVKDNMLRILIDAFDSNGDGEITLQEFVDFLGPMKEKNSGISLSLGSKCCWLTTCPLTGMPNGYSVSVPTKRFLKSQMEQQRSEKNAKRKADEDDYEDDFVEESKNNQENLTTGKMIVKELNNGEKRLYVELIERSKRESFLLKYGLLTPEAIKNHHLTANTKSKKGNDEEEEYEFDYDDDDGNGKQKSLQKGKKLVLCEFASYTSPDASTKEINEKKQKAVRFLNSLSKENREEAQLKILIQNGKPPQAPKLVSDMEKVVKVNKKKEKRRNDDEEVSEETELLLKWSPASNDDLVSFYSLEFGGPVLSKTESKVKYVEICRDPEDSEFGKSFNLGFLHENLKPGVLYRYRIRAFNGFGSGDYTYKTFMTLPPTPLPPRVIKISHDSVTLKWIFNSDFYKRIAELKSIFQAIDVDKSNSISREELSNGIAERQHEYSDLTNFLKKSMAQKGIDLSQGYGALFDTIEVDDDEHISWQEFESFFLNLGWSNVVISAESQNGSSATNLRSSTASFNLRSSTKLLSSTSSSIQQQGISSPFQYIIEKCVNEIDNEYTEVLRTGSGYGTIAHLKPSSSYRFRIRSINDDGVRSIRTSPSIVIHTLPELPSPPLLLTVSSTNTSSTSLISTTNPGTNTNIYYSPTIRSNSVLVTWKKREPIPNVAASNSGGTRRDAHTVDKILNDWAHMDGQNEEGVSIAKIFGMYDRDRSGDIDPSELVSLFNELGIPVDDEKINRAFRLMTQSSNSNNYDVDEEAKDYDEDDPFSGFQKKKLAINFESFSNWWRSEIVEYILKRSEPIIPGYILRLKSCSAPTDLTVNNMTSKSTLVLNRLTTPRSSSRGRLMGTTGRESLVPEPTPLNNNTSNKFSINNRQVSCPVIVYRDAKVARLELNGLEPNSLYHLKLRYSGIRSNSLLSQPLIFMTAPAAPMTPILVDVTNNTIRVKWYPSLINGAYKFVVHMKVIGFVNAQAKNATMKKEGMTSRHASSTAISNSNSLIGQDSGDGWVNVYNGFDTFYMNTTLSSDMIYELRVFSVNFFGNMSEPSDVLRIQTLSRNDSNSTTNLQVPFLSTNYIPLTVRNASSFFTIECTGDISIGDTILITERLFSKAKSSRSSLSRNDIVESRSINKSSTLRKSTSKINTLNQSMSNMSMMSEKSIYTTTHNDQAFIGERTLAAIVFKDNYRTIRENYFHECFTTNKNIQRISEEDDDIPLLNKYLPNPPQPSELKFKRKLWLQVIWQKFSSNINEYPSNIDLKPGDVLERIQGNLEEFEVFRVPWRNEKARKSLQQEWDVLNQCFIPME